MAEQVTFINLRPVWMRLPLIVLAVAALCGAWYGLRWCVGATMAEWAQDLETAESATRLAPADPQSHLKVARLRRVSFEPEDLPEALRRYEQAAALAPNDYLIWTEMGRALGASGDSEGGVRALRRATELAPHYSLPRWHLGNALLRAGRTDEAFAELRLAAEADPALLAQVFNLAWQVYDQDMPRVIEAVGSSALARAQLTVVLVGRKRLDDALAVWSGLSAEEKQLHPGAGEALIRALYEQGQHRSALRALGEQGTQGLAAERIANGGFESDIGPPGKQLFQWQVANLPPGASVAIDSRSAHGGQRSLRLSFNAPSQIDFKSVSQLVVAEAATRYRLTFFVRTEELKSAASLYTEVLDATGEGAVLGASPTVPVGTQEWQPVTVEFTTGPRTQSVLVRLNRAGCADGVCPIFGKIWYDDFDLQRAAQRNAAR
ncbi:MAG TPA: hypothetical protein VFS10_01210 [Pyrinomonadaceae bacterium]|nr:hypothetical protein [Pyrinomonadaceae bacterium]